MSATVIQVESLSKRYRLGVVGSRTLHHDFERWWARVRGKPDPFLKIGQESAKRKAQRGKRLAEDAERTAEDASGLPLTACRLPLTTCRLPLAASLPDEPDYIWALRDVSFEVKQGEVLGIIGRNGAGKSTLLKILSRTTAPTYGEVRIKGRVASLLEVGTGFHPELTGRENVFLNGAILGMTKAEIRRKFDEIVAFSEVERFIDTPVKRYSSGMYVRLAFAVAAHLDPEILIVDEVLAVGDIAFQKKCLGKMEDVSQHGRTVLFVSHNMASISRLCGRSILLESGSIRQDGQTPDVVSLYFREAIATPPRKAWPALAESPGDEWVRLRSVTVQSKSGEMKNEFDVREEVHIRFEYEVLKEGKCILPKLDLLNQEGAIVFVSQDNNAHSRTAPKVPGHYVSTVTIPANLLTEGTFTVSPALATHLPDMIQHVWEHQSVAFRTFDLVQGDSSRGDYTGYMPGSVRPLLPWVTNPS